MDGELFLKVCAAGILGAVVGVLLRGMKNDISFAVKMAGVVIIFGAAMVYLDRILGMIEDNFLVEGTSEYLDVMARCLGISVLSGITSDICRDCGENGISVGVELIGKLEILIIAFPIITKIFSAVQKLLFMEG